MKLKINLLIVLVFSSLFSNAQVKDSLNYKKEKEFKNTVHFNLTNPLIFGKRSIILGYERVIGKHQSFTINIGQASFPSLNIVDTQNLKVNTILAQKGFNLSVDYRFYLEKENKYNAPRGVYIGPYYSYNYFNKKHSWTLNSEKYSGNVDTDLGLRVQAIGGELGYQFIFWKRLSVDLVLLGPGLAFYKLNAALGTNLPETEKHLFFEELNQALSDKFPGYNSVINEGNFKKTGSENAISLGFRYMVQVGFRF